MTSSLFVAIAHVISAGIFKLERRLIVCFTLSILLSWI